MRHTHRDAHTRTEALTTETLTNTQRQKFSDKNSSGHFALLATHHFQHTAKSAY